MGASLGALVSAFGDEQRLLKEGAQVPLSPKRRSRWVKWLVVLCIFVCPAVYFRWRSSAPKVSGVAARPVVSRVADVAVSGAAAVVPVAERVREISLVWIAGQSVGIAIDEVMYEAGIGESVAGYTVGMCGKNWVDIHDGTSARRYWIGTVSVSKEVSQPQGRSTSIPSYQGIDKDGSTGTVSTRSITR